MFRLLFIISLLASCSQVPTYTDIDTLIEYAEQGDADAQFNLGVRYAEGKGVPEDDAEALQWYHKAAEQGHAVAQSNLGVIYAEGRGVPKDDTKAGHWYQKAAEQGHIETQLQALIKAAKQGDGGSQLVVGIIYGQGNGVSKDHVQAMQWYRKAAEQGNTWAQLMLGIVYATGEWVSKDYTQAVYWIRKAAEQGNASAQAMLGVMYATAGTCQPV